MSTTTFPNLVDLRALPTPTCELGENPLFDYRRNKFYWTDVPTGKIYAYSLDDESVDVIYEGETAAGFTLQSDGRLLLFRTNDAVALCPDSKEITPWLTFDIKDGGRFNDVIADAMGRVYCGRSGTKDGKGGLYRLNYDGTIDLLWTGTDCSNGMGFSRSLETFYWTCSTTKTIFRFHWDAATGDLTDRQEFIKVEGNETPDGLTIDHLDRIFSARWDGSSIVVYSPEGEELDRLDIPEKKVTSMVAGGFNMDQIFITTAGGKVYQGRLTSPGKPEYPSRVLLVEESPKKK